MVQVYWLGPASNLSVSNCPSIFWLDGLEFFFVWNSNIRNLIFFSLCKCCSNFIVPYSLISFCSHVVHLKLICYKYKNFTGTGWEFVARLAQWWAATFMLLDFGVLTIPQKSCLCIHLFVPWEMSVPPIFYFRKFDHPKIST